MKLSTILILTMMQEEMIF